MLGTISCAFWHSACATPGIRKPFLHIDYEQRGVAGIEILEAMLLAAQLDHAVDHELRDRDLVHPVLARLLGLRQPVPRATMAG